MNLARRTRLAYPHLLLVLVPRHVKRASQILRLAQKDGGTAVLRSTLNQTALGGTETLIVDSMGELRFLYSLATVIFVGKSLCGTGGQNVIEAAASGRPVVWGPHMEHFEEVAAAFLQEDAAVQVENAEDLGRAVDALLSDGERRAEIGSRALAVVARNRGAADRAADLLSPLLG